MKEQDENIFKLENLLESEETPGPGYYYNPIAHSSFSKRNLPEEFQIFGSSSARFSEPYKNSLSSNVPNENLGPGCYFRDDSSIELRKLKEMLNKSKTNTTNLNKELSKSPQKIIGIFKVRDEIPGPGSYTLPTLKVKGNPNSKGVFGSSEKKFARLERELNENENIGPGAYTKEDNWVKIDKNSISKIMASPKRFIKPKLIDRGLEAHEIEITDKNIVPPVGTYNLDKPLSMEYSVAKNVAKLNLINAPFSSLSLRFKDSNFIKETDLGPGYYYKYNKFKPKPNKYGFNTSENREAKSSSPVDKKILVGPGQYNRESYFDWNKKSFNIQFL